MVTASDEKVWCNCPKFHKGPITIHTRREHRKIAGIPDTPDPSPTFHPHDQRQTDNEEHEKDIRDIHIFEATTPESPIIEDHLSNDNFDDSMMDVDWEDDDGLRREDIDGCREIASEDDYGADDSEDEEIEESNYANPIDSDEEVDFFDEENESISDEEMDEMDVDGFGSSDPDEIENIMLLLQQLKELSGANLDISGADV